MDYYTVKRPTMSQIVQWLQGLHVFNGVFGVVEGCLQEWDSLILLQWRKKAQIGKDVLRRMLNKSSTELFSFLWVWLCEPNVMLLWELIWYEKTWYIVF